MTIAQTGGPILAIQKLSDGKSGCAVCLNAIIDTGFLIAGQMRLPCGDPAKSIKFSDSPGIAGNRYRHIDYLGHL